MASLRLTLSVENRQFEKLISLTGNTPVSMVQMHFPTGAHIDIGNGGWTTIECSTIPRSSGTVEDTIAGLLRDGWQEIST